MNPGVISGYLPVLQQSVRSAEGKEEQENGQGF